NRDQLIDAIIEDSKRHRTSTARLYPITAMLRYAELATIRAALDTEAFQSALREAQGASSASPTEAPSSEVLDEHHHVALSLSHMGAFKDLMLSRGLCRNEHNMLRAFLGYHMAQLQMFDPTTFTKNSVLFTDMERLHFARTYPEGSTFDFRRTTKAGELDITPDTEVQLKTLDRHVDHWNLI